MKTIEEKAEEWYKYIAENPIYDVDVTKLSYIAGAKDQKDIDRALWLKLKSSWGKEAQINHGIDMKSIEERAKKWSEHIVETTPYDVVNGKVCVFAKDRDIADVAEESYIAGATNQKAIDEKVRLKKSDDMTEKQLDREECFTSWYFQNAKGAPTFSDAIEWARKQTIDEVCNWLGNYLVWEHEMLTKAGCESVINELRKALEE